MALVQKVTIGAYFGQFQLKDDIDSDKLGGCQLIHAKKYLRWIDNVIVMILLQWRKMKTQATGFFIMVMMPVFMVTMTLMTIMTMILTMMMMLANPAASPIGL